MFEKRIVILFHENDSSKSSDPEHFENSPGWLAEESDGLLFTNDSTLRGRNDNEPGIIECKSWQTDLRNR
jgi:hypothetical protein